MDRNAWIAQLNVIHREALLNGRCLDSANRVGRNNVVPNGGASTRHFPRRDVEVESNGNQHCASRQNILTAVVVRRWYDDRVGGLQRPDLRSVIASRDIRLNIFSAARCSRQLGKIDIKQYKRRACYRSGIDYPFDEDGHVASDSDIAACIGQGTLSYERDATLDRSIRGRGRGLRLDG